MTVKFLCKMIMKIKNYFLSNNTIFLLKNFYFNLNCKCIDLFIKTERPIRMAKIYTGINFVQKIQMDKFEF